MNEPKDELVRAEWVPERKTSRRVILAYLFGGIFLGAVGLGFLLASEEVQKRMEKLFPETAQYEGNQWGLIYAPGEGESEAPLQWVRFQEHSSARPSSSAHVSELARYLDQVQIGEPIFYRQLAVYPLFLEHGGRLEGRWLTLDEAMRRGVLVVTEKEGGSVPVVMVENRSREEYVFIMRGEILSGGKQTRTVREDVILAPGQRVELSVFCVERGRWHGGDKFSGSSRMVPLAVQKQIAQGEGQSSVWESVRGLAQKLQAASPSENLEMALDAPHVRRDLDKVQKEIAPRIPARTMGFLFLQGRRPVGADMFGDAQIARELLPKLLDAYAVDCILLEKDAPAAERAGVDQEAIEFFKRIVRAGSQRAQTPGSGAGVRTDSLGLVGGGVSFGGTVVHYGVYVRREPIIPMPYPKPMEGFRPHQQHE